MMPKLNQIVPNYSTHPVWITHRGVTTTTGQIPFIKVNYTYERLFLTKIIVFMYIKTNTNVKQMTSPVPHFSDHFPTISHMSSLTSLKYYLLPVQKEKKAT